ncbi:MAG: RNA-binding domain-containing protein [Methanomassiliicoccales archaeon]
MSLHNLHFRAFCHATEDEGKVMKALIFASGCEENNVGRMKCEGHHGNPIIILDVDIRSSIEIRKVFSRLSKRDLQTLIDDLERRVDEECSFFFRLDKQNAFEGIMILGEKNEGNDVIAVHGKIKTYPKSRKRALETMKEYLISIA